MSNSNQGHHNQTTTTIIIVIVGADLKSKKSDNHQIHFMFDYLHKYLLVTIMVVEAMAEAQAVMAIMRKTIKKKRKCRMPSHQLSSGKSPM
jgi:hypothetical protein